MPSTSINTLQKTSFEQYLGQIKSTVPGHANFATASRVFECLAYIEENLEEIASMAGKKNLLRHPGNNLAFHLNGMNSPKDVQANFSALLSEVRGCIEQILAIEDIELQAFVLSSFVSNINDSAVGCMEARLRPAIKFFSLYQSSGNLHIDNLMQEYHLETDGDYSVASLLSHFADRVEHHLTIIDVDGTLKALSWDIIKEYLRETLAIEDMEAQWLNYGNSQQDVVTLAERKWQQFYFDSESSAKRHLSYIKSIIPAFEADLAKATIKHDEHNGWTFRLTQDQYAIYQGTLQLSQHQPEAMPASTPLIAMPTDPLLEKFKTSDVLIKSIRWDNKNFLLSFLDGITPVKDQPRHKKPLRQGNHKPWTVYGTGFYKRSKKPSPYPHKPEKIKTKKEKRSQPQSTTLVNPAVQSPVFGHQANRRDKLAGYMFLAEDALMNRWFKYDTGTINRPYEHQTKESAKEYYKQKVLASDPVLFKDFEEFKAGISKQDNKLNEVLARIRWKDGKSCVAVYSDTFEARCIAQHYAESLKHQLKIKAETEGAAWDDNIDIPIINYLPGNSKHWTRYTLEEQANDRKQANAIINDKNKLNTAMTKSNLEFLLLAEDPSSLLELPVQRNNVILKLFSGTHCLFEHLAKKEKLSHLALSLMYRAIMKNDKKTNSFLQANSEVLNTMLIQAAKSGHVECVKTLLTHPDIDVNAQNRDGGSALMCAAEKGHADCMQALLARSDIDVNAQNRDGGSALIWAAEKGHADCMQALLARPDIDVNAQSNFGSSALICAAINGHADCVKALLAHPDIDVNAQDKFNSTSALMWAAANGHADCVKELLTHPNIDVNAQDEDGHSALIRAANNGHKDCVKILLTHPDIDVNAKVISIIGHSALSLAAQNGHTDCVKVLLITSILDYLKSLSARESEFQPRAPLFASFFGANGYSKTAKMQAAMKVLSLLNNTPQDTTLTEDDIAALKNGKLGDIVKYLPDQDKVRIGLSRPK